MASSFVCWSSVSAPVEYSDDFICLGNEEAASYAQLLLSLKNPYLEPSESLAELESVAREVSEKFPEYVSSSGFCFLVKKQTNVEAV
jgi:hypothetical protein